MLYICFFLLSLMLFFLFFSSKMVFLNGITNEHYDITSKRCFLLIILMLLRLRCYSAVSGVQNSRYCFIVVVKLSKKEARNIS